MEEKVGGTLFLAKVAKEAARTPPFNKELLVAPTPRKREEEVEGEDNMEERATREDPLARNLTLLAIEIMYLGK